MKITFETDDEYTARHMLNWYKYYAACNDIRIYIRNALKHGDVDEATERRLETIRDCLPYEDDEG